jgi:hypothetical protein
MVLAALQPGGQLHVANLGDCGVKVMREGRVLYETKPQQHDFNLPYQLSHPQLFPDTDTADSADRCVNGMMCGWVWCWLAGFWACAWVLVQETYCACFL